MPYLCQLMYSVLLFNNCVLKHVLFNMYILSRLNGESEHADYDLLLITSMKICSPLIYRNVGRPTVNKIMTKTTPVTTSRGAFQESTYCHLYYMRVMISPVAATRKDILATLPLREHIKALYSCRIIRR